MQRIIVENTRVLRRLELISLSDELQVETYSARRIVCGELPHDTVAVVGSRAVATGLISHLPASMRLFQLTSAGWDGVPIADYVDNGVIVANAGDVYSVPIAETVVFGMLAMAKRLRENPRNRLPKLQRHYSLIGELYGKSAVVLGTGSIGGEVLRRLKGFGMELCGYNRTNKNSSLCDTFCQSRNELLAKLSGFDYVVCALPDNAGTRGFIDEEFLASCKRKCVLVNVGRRAVLNENALYCALKQGELGGAVLDMFEVIPNPITNRFRRLRNVIVIPGIAAVSREAEDRLIQLIEHNIRAMSLGEEVLHSVCLTEN